MSSIYRNYSNALSLYQGGYRGWKRTGNLDAKTYYKKLRDMVVFEYRTQGFCKLVDEIIEGKNEVEAISFHSLEAAGEILRRNKKKKYVQHVPAQITDVRGIFTTLHSVTGEKLTRYLQQYGTAMTYRYEESIKNTLLRLKIKGQKSHLKVLKKYYQAGENEVKSKVEQIVAKAREDSSRIKKEAQIEAERIRSEAYSDATKYIQSEEASNLSKEAIQEYLKREREMVRTALDKEYEDALDKSYAVLGTAERIHNEMCDQTNNLQASWVKVLDKTVENLTAIKEDFYKRIRNWQVGLYPHELRPFAERYIELYHIVNVDKIIAEELFRSNTGNNTDKSEQETARVQLDNTRNVIAMEESQKDDSVFKYNSYPVLEELEKLNRKLNTFLKRYESSLSGLDMYVYHPQSGEVYDEVWHVIEDDLEFDYSKEYRVRRCILPGVAKKVNDDDEDDVIIPAIVEV